MKFDELIMLVFFYVCTAASSVLMMTTPPSMPLDNPIFQAEGDNQRPNPVVVFADRSLTGACVLGALAGALMSVVAFPGKASEDPTQALKARREMASKFLAALISGVAFTPVLVRWTGIMIDNDHIIGVSTFVSFFSVTILHKSLPMIESNVGAWLERVFTRLFGK